MAAPPHGGFNLEVPEKEGAAMYDSPCSRIESKTPHHHVANRLETEAGLCPAQIRVALDIFASHFDQYYSELRYPGTVIDTAVSLREPAGKPLKYCAMVAVKLTLVHGFDAGLQAEHGSVVLRRMRALRMCTEAYAQGAALTCEDLSLLLGVDVSTVKDMIKHLRRDGFFVPTRGAVKDIGPQPSHKRVIAEMLGRGFSTTAIEAVTTHSESSIARYQQQFGLVLHLVHSYPDAPDDERRLVADLSPKAYEVYCDVARTLAKREECRPHLERLRRRYELDPEGVAYASVTTKSRSGRDPAARLKEHNLGNCIRQIVQEDLGTTTRVAEAVTDDLVAVIGDSFRLPEALRPGEAVAFVDAHDPTLFAGDKAADRGVIPVTMPLYTEEVQAIWRSDEPISRRRAHIATIIATSVWEQGGVMSVAGLAELLHTSASTMARDLRELAVEVHVAAPTKGLMEDAGPTLSHKSWIVGLDQHGLTGEEISWLTRHAPASRDRYIQTFRRAEALMRLDGRIPEARELAAVLCIRPQVAQQYVDLLHRHHGCGSPIDD
jgi:Mn-dependent DtxR family transcriptional regulator